MDDLVNGGAADAVGPGDLAETLPLLAITPDGFVVQD